jgi:hypothetical protein
MFQIEIPHNHSLLAYNQNNQTDLFEIFLGMYSLQYIDALKKDFSEIAF